MATERNTMSTTGTTSTVYSTLDSPIGPITVAGDGEVVTNLRMVDQSHPPADQGQWHFEPEAFPEALGQLEAYFGGRLTRFDLPLRLDGTEFQRRVWDALVEIPYGETASYGEIAGRIGSPGAARAVGLANGRNPVGIIVPCHRVIGSDGSLTGYGGGLERKLTLLQLEREHRTPAIPRSA
jgi:methylated-DNA-[protein]-cysteine S-methyltransferase